MPSVSPAYNILSASKLQFCLGVMDVISRPNFGKIARPLAAEYLRDFRVNTLKRQDAYGSIKNIGTVQSTDASESQTLQIAERVRGIEVDFSKGDDQNLSQLDTQNLELALRVPGISAIENFLNDVNSRIVEIDPGLPSRFFSLAGSLAMTPLGIQQFLHFIVPHLLNLFSADPTDMAIRSFITFTTFEVASKYFLRQDYDFTFRDKQIKEKIKTMSSSNDWLYASVDSRVETKFFRERPKNPDQKFELSLQNTSNVLPWYFNFLDQLTEGSDARPLRLRTDVLVTYDEVEQRPVLLVFVRSHRLKPSYPQFVEKKEDLYIAEPPLNLVPALASVPPVPARRH